VTNFIYTDASPSISDAYLWPVIEDTIRSRQWTSRSAFDLGCGPGTIAHMVSKHGFEVFGVDSSVTAVKIANKTFPHLRIEIGDLYSDLAERYGTFPLVISLDVVEHCFEPRKFAKTVYNLLNSDGVGVVSTPYHGWLKNVAIGVSNKYDHHHDPLNDGGHIKFFSIPNFTALFEEAGFRKIAIRRVGRIQALARAMVAILEK
jgi:SAM-dependent methyltransferase